MMLSIFLFFLFLAIGLFIVGFKYVGQLKYGSQLFHIASAFLVLMCGLIVLAQGVDFRSGSVISQVGSNFTISDTYTSLHGGLQDSFGLSILLIVLSFALFLYTFFEFKYARSNESNSRSYDEEE